ncbi:hypothetical protein ATB97_10985 [Elizabethkingia bruuniana]|nr:hypothetical protein AYC65_20060 [Elizabethkingia bruuniana]KGO09334.1 hypothetical protein KS04_14920 [Elizabethkingia miricola]KUY23893.1 hypothetical protein ATB97_10985 [Elizabethkingia bruuniana]OPB61515.1 hypothetical protein BAY12_13635 [Elizabethkingia bruuniana]
MQFMVKVMKNRLKNRFENRIKIRPICNGKSFMKENYKASDFKLSCGITLAKFEKLKYELRNIHNHFTKL